MPCVYSVNPRALLSMEKNLMKTANSLETTEPLNHTGLKKKRRVKKKFGSMRNGS